jgi:hypothetical protein
MPEGLQLLFSFLLVSRPYGRSGPTTILSRRMWPWNLNSAAAAGLTGPITHHPVRVRAGQLNELKPYWYKRGSCIVGRVFLVSHSQVIKSNAHEASSPDSAIAREASLSHHHRLHSQCTAGRSLPFWLPGEMSWTSTADLETPIGQVQITSEYEEPRGLSPIP